MTLPTVSRLLRGALRTQVLPVANLTSKPAKHSISAGEQAIAMTVLFVTILGPSGWVLAHLEDYKKKQ
ncbi:cytochrome c oxidase subunit 8B [Stegastes partitus]|uniref:Cytochrome c oxidase subunit 8B, mitochondrial-like n=1 Tax=Stegastes partitus TaxID=144197 RepID=A0A3B4ZX35_9TELE|nr:PREDICTED: cytochrome c oxidase subunit 8B, mitochondrial-like [Stegastes partitus]